MFFQNLANYGMNFIITKERILKTGIYPLFTFTLISTQRKQRRLTIFQNKEEQFITDCNLHHK